LRQDESNEPADVSIILQTDHTHTHTHTHKEREEEIGRETARDSDEQNVVYAYFVSRH